MHKIARLVAIAEQMDMLDELDFTESQQEQDLIEEVLRQQY
jgi:hypothetical protein